MEKILLEKMRTYFDKDTKRINHAEKVLSFAKNIMKTFRGGDGDGVDENVIIPSAILHDIGIKECKRKYNSNSGKLQEIESPPIAKKMMEEIGLSQKIIKEVCEIIANHHSPKNLNTLNFKILLDADLLVNLIEENKINNTSYANYSKFFNTTEGKKILKKLEGGK